MNVIERPGGFRSRRFVFTTLHAAAEVRSIAHAAGWQQTVDRPATPEGDVPLLLTWEVLPGLTVSYTEKAGIETSFVLASSSLGAAEVEGCIAVFAAHPRVLSFDALIATCDAADSPPAQGMALARAGLGAPIEEDERFIERLEAGAFAADGAVREGALWGMAYAEWPTFRNSLAEASRTDPDEFLRRVAASALRAFDRIGVPTP
ncbi:hypothetical protein PUR49_22925 [Streptomyces sp. BE147]|uniref:hypothetical protein n=1 Tax=Streptomyces sp. BE147 TaxID=3002524 RepID=UPI002E785427|nr:hypothetical protein [Streptomyces sp. BE147]MEE1739342.1 hypothetical protein [Streptomyces sp. BE147]